MLRSGKYTDEQIDIEYRGILESIEQERQKGTFLDIFRQKHVRRTWVVIGANFFLQGTGQLFTSIYGALFAKSLGTINPFNVTIMIAVVNVFTSLLAMVLTDKLGRRYVSLQPPHGTCANMTGCNSSLVLRSRQPAT